MSQAPLLDVQGLKVIFPTAMGMVRAVEGIDLAITPGECAALVGESGCGKSVSSQAILRLLSSPPALMSARRLQFDGQDLQTLTEQQMAQIRGRKVGMVFQDALTALNPVMSVGRQLDEVFIKHCGMNKSQAKETSIKALATVGVSSPDQRYRQFPHQLSGGMRQRVLIAMAFAADPKLIIADEPTTALDVTIQMQVLEELKTLQQERHTALLLITHDLSVVNFLADKIYVMYSGKIVESGPVKQLLGRPFHPYTEGLLASVPRLDTCTARYYQIPDQVPNPMNKPSGCHFHPRCSYRDSLCAQHMPPLRELMPGRMVRCHHPLMNKDEGTAHHA
ncbi:MAG: ABC transporter ATP-binding protein [Clostridiales bacterium]|nr:ABC transporter ATP-binding protein [Clostridiales bacterium]